MNEKDIEISICITTYFHEKYIKQALESVLSQNISCNYEVCISDDCSNDNTQLILKEYAKKYDFIHLKLNKNNIGLTQNMFQVRCMAKGKYLVMLSGDDYYIDNWKIQKQYDFLKENPNYFGVCTVVETRADNSRKRITRFPARKHRNKEFTLNMFLKGYNYPLSGMMYKNVLLKKKYFDYLSITPKVSKYIDDVTDSILLLTIGRIFILQDCCTVYRIRRKHKGDQNFTSSNKGISSYEKHIKMLNNLEIELGNKLFLFYRYKDVLQSFWIQSFISKTHKEYINIYKTIPEKYRKKNLYFKSVLNVLFTLPKKLIIKLLGG